jgi:hypothetical protein
MKKLRFLGLLVTVLLLAFGLMVACDNGTTTDETGDGTPPTVYTDTANDITITFSSGTIPARARAVGPYDGDNYQIKKTSTGAILSEGTVGVDNNGNVTFRPRSGDQFVGQLRNGILSINTTLDGTALTVSATTIPDGQGGGAGGGGGGGGGGSGGTVGGGTGGSVGGGTGGGTGSGAVFVNVTSIYVTSGTEVVVASGADPLELKGQALPLTATVSGPVTWAMVGTWPNGVVLTGSPLEVQVDPATYQFPGGAATATVQVRGSVANGLKDNVTFYSNPITITLVDAAKMVPASTINVDSALASGLALNAGTGSLDLKATVLPANATIKTVTWTVSDGDAANLATQGLKIHGGKLVATDYYGTATKVELTATVITGPASTDKIDQVIDVPITGTRFVQVLELGFPSSWADSLNSGTYEVTWGITGSGADFTTLGTTPGAGDFALPTLEVFSANGNIRPTVTQVTWILVDSSGVAKDDYKGVSVRGSTLTVRSSGEETIYVKPIVANGEGQGNPAEGDKIKITVLNPFIAVTGITFTTAPAIFVDPNPTGGYTLSGGASVSYLPTILSGSDVAVVTGAATLAVVLDPATVSGGTSTTAAMATRQTITWSKPTAAADRWPAGVDLGTVDPTTTALPIVINTGSLGAGPGTLANTGVTLKIIATVQGGGPLGGNYVSVPLEFTIKTNP